MATCRVGSLGIKLPKFESGKVPAPRQHTGITLRIRNGKLKFGGVSMANKTRNAGNLCYGVSLDTTTVTKDAEESSMIEALPLRSSLIPNSSEIESLISGICSTSSIAEFELKVGTFELHVLRNLKEELVPVPPSALVLAPPEIAPPSGGTSIVKSAAASNGATSSTALTVTDSSSTGIKKYEDKASDESLTLLTSPAVGVFRTSFTIKGKRLPPLCGEKQMVKKGSILGCIEQMSGRIKVRSNISGEIVQLVRKDGEPVGYGDPLIAILPSFPGIKNLLPSAKT